ncbi:hypothetical protein FE257_004596 [Aspergillus nanangensis]|uniref:Uncharacterized protein n=1 Tax=Aspergillus nanangensis TaxID=2582783 RepID=A0AAD4GZD8_ASPNN|nr:hypothetical protein FE257_004596 [Aspergillus nanangensis]
MLSRPVSALAVVSAAISSVMAADVVTLGLLPFGGYTGVGQVIGTSGSLTSYLIKDVPATIVAGPSIFYETHVYPNGDYMSQGCKMRGPSSMDCSAYMSDKGSGSTSVSVVPSANLVGAGNFVVTITATATTGGTVTESESESDAPASITAHPTGTGTGAAAATSQTGSESSSEAATPSTSGAEPASSTDSGASHTLVGVI